MDNLLRAIETSALGVWLRNPDSMLAFPAVLTCHTIGMALAAGLNAAIGLRVLGAAPGVPLRELTRYFPVLWFGFWLNAASGVLLLVAYPAKALSNPLFYAKLVLIAIGLVAQTRLRRGVLSAPDPARPGPRDTRWAIVSLASWTAAITSGRLLAYTYSRLLIG